VFFDALRVKIREDAVVRNKAVYLVPSVTPDGTRDILGLWIENTEGVNFRMKLLSRHICNIRFWGYSLPRRRRAEPVAALAAGAQVDGVADVLADGRASSQHRHG